MKDSELPQCPECGKPAQTFDDNGWYSACSACRLTLGPYLWRTTAVENRIALTAPKQLEIERSRTTELREELARVRRERDELRAALEETVKSLSACVRDLARHGEPKLPQGTINPNFPVLWRAETLLKEATP